MTKYVFHSEKGEHTCDKCKSYDGKVFYDIKDIPNLPLHPNCKCYIETVEEGSSGEGCDCRKRVENVKRDLRWLFNNLENHIKIAENKVIDLQNGFELRKKAYEFLELNKNLLKPELGRHALNCPKNTEELFKNVCSILLYLKEDETKARDLIKKTVEIKEKFKSIKAYVEDELINTAQSVSDNIIPIFHTKEECNCINKLENLENKILTTRYELENYVKKFDGIKDGIKQIEERVEKALMLCLEIKNIKNTSCNCKRIEGAPQMSPGEEIGETIIRSVELPMPIASGNAQNGMDDFKKARENKEAYVVDSPSGVPDKGVENLLKEVGVPKNSRGVVYMPKSKESKKLFKSDEIQKYIKDNKDKLTKNKENETEDFEFLKTAMLDDDYYGIQHCKLYNPRITDDGYFEAIIVDYYDFEHRNGDSWETMMKDWKLIMNNWGTIMNNWGYMMQEKGLLENYFNLYYIREKVEK